MKTTLLLLSCLAALAIAPRADAAANLYVSPSGSDSNDCLTATTACKTPNRAILRTGGIVQDAITINFDVGNYYPAPFASDGGAPNIPDGRGVIDLEGFTFAPQGSLTLLGSTQQVNPAGLVVGAIDAGSLTTTGGVKYQGWVQFAIDGGWGDYAVDAGYAYLDAGVGFLIDNALVGEYVNFTTGAGAITAPVVSNTKDTINYATHAGTPQQNPTGPTAASKFNVFALKSHIYPYPVDAGVATSYSEATVYTSSLAAQSGPNIIANPINAGSIPTTASVVLQYLDFVGTPEGANTMDYSQVDNFSTSLVNFVNDNFECTGDGVATNWPGAALAISASNLTLTSAATGITAWGGRVFETGDYVHGAATYQLKATNSTTVLAECDTLVDTATTGGAAVSLDSASLAVDGVFLDLGNTVGTAINMTHGSKVNLFAITTLFDGGAGAVSCGAGGNIGNLSGLTITDAGATEVSTDNGVTWTTQTARKAQDGGSAGVNAFCNVGTGCCYTSY